MKLAVLISSGCLVACSSVQPAIGERMAPTHSIQEILNACPAENSLDVCEEFNRKNVIVEGTLYFPSKKTFQPLLFPVGEKIPEHENDERWLDESLPDPIKLRITGISKQKNNGIYKFHKKNVIVEAKTNSECVTGWAGIRQEQKENPDEIIWLSGYCHGIDEIYLSDFEIQLAPLELNN